MKDLTFDQMCLKISNNENFSFARYGDGEWAAILGKKGQNCDGHTYFPEMGRRLKKIVESKPKYYMGLQNLASKKFASQIESFEFKDWVKSDILHKASIHNRLHLLGQALSLHFRDTILVGPEYYKASIKTSESKLLASMFKWMYLFVYTKEHNCWEQYESIRNTLKSNLEARKNVVVIYCASMMSNVLIDDMYNIYGNTITQIDVGSVLDPYVGKSTRGYHSKIIERLQSQ